MLERFKIFLTDLYNRWNMETIFLRRHDPWKYTRSQYEKERLDAMWEQYVIDVSKRALKWDVVKGCLPNVWPVSATLDLCRYRVDGASTNAKGN